MFRFDKEKHEYWLGDRRLPSVTEIISPFDDWTKIPPKVLEHKRVLGTEFHSIIHLYLKDDLDESSIDERLIAPFNAFKEWSTPNLESFRKAGLIEHSMCDEKLMYAGTADLIMPDDIYDWKLRPYMPVKDILQLCAYDKMAGGKKRRRWAVCFDLEGDYQQHRAEDKQAWPMFKAMLDHYHGSESFRKLCDNWKGSVK